MPVQAYWHSSAIGLAQEAVNIFGGSGDAFWGVHFTSRYAGLAPSGRMILTLGVTSTPQVVGYKFLTLSTAAHVAPAPAEQQWQLQFHFCNFEEPSCIMAKHPGCVAGQPCTPQPPLTLVCLVLPSCRRPVAREGLVRDDAALYLQGSCPGLAAWPSWLRRPLLCLCGPCGARRARALGSDGALSAVWGGSGSDHLCISH